MGYKDRWPILAEDHAEKIVPGNSGVFCPMIVLNGEIVGTWKRQLKSGVVNIDVIPFVILDAYKEEIHREALRYADFMRLPINIKFDDGEKI